MQENSTARLLEVWLDGKNDDEFDLLKKSRATNFSSSDPIFIKIHKPVSSSALVIYIRFAVCTAKVKPKLTKKSFVILIDEKFSALDLQGARIQLNSILWV